MTTSTRTEASAKKDVTKLQRAIVDGLEDVKAQDIQVLDVRDKQSITDYMIIATGTSNRQIGAMLDKRGGNLDKLIADLKNI